MQRYYLTSVAENDVRNIWDYIAADNIAAADQMIDRFTAFFNLLAANPEAGEEISHRTRSFRRATVPPYVIYYQLTGSKVAIVRVLHGARNWEDLL